jgi:hypothetical protein
MEVSLHGALLSFYGSKQRALFLGSKALQSPIYEAWGRAVGVWHGECRTERTLSQQR